MVSGRPPGDASGRTPSRRGKSSAEEGLRSLGSQIDGTSGRGGAPNELGLRALGEKIDRAPKTGRGTRTKGVRRSGKPRWTKKRKILTGVAAGLVIILIIVAGGYGYLQYRFDQFTKVNVASEHQVVSGAPFNMLVIGSDSRVGLTGAAEAQAGSSAVVQGQRSDVIMIWHVVPATRQITIMSIPRDTLVQMVGSNVSQLGEFNRINSSFDSGPDLLVQTIQDNLGIPINHVVQVDFGGLSDAVTALGGVWMNFPYPAKDVWSGLNIPTQGCQLLNGTQALAVARSRHYQYYENGYWQYDGTSDFGRIQRQGAFLRSLIDAAKSKYNPLTLNSFVTSLPKGIVIDKQFSLNELIGLAQDFHGFAANSLNTQTLPTLSTGYVSPWGDILFVDQPAAQQMLVSIFGNELTTLPSPPPSTDLQPTAPPEVTTTVPPTAVPATAAASTPTTAASGPAPAPPPAFDPTPCTPQ
jgi:LCP family protein required for cell wall assembly